MNRDLVVVGASAGGVRALTTLVGTLPADLPAAVMIVLHLAPRGRSMLPSILDRAGPLPARAARNGEPLDAGRIYVAPPDVHMVLDGPRIALTHGPFENGSRPAVDPLFRSAALEYRTRAIAVVLYGALDDGTAGARAVKAAGGLVVAQDPEDAAFSAMPASVIEEVGADRVAPAIDLGPILCGLVRQTAPPPPPMDADERARLVMEDDIEHGARGQPLGPASGLTCPDCNGSMFDAGGQALVRFRCLVGHAYGANALDAKKATEVEEALWAAVRALRERAHLAHRMRARARHAAMADAYGAEADDAERRARILEELIDRSREKPEDSREMR